MTFRFDLVDLQLFLNVAEAGSITAGAEAMHLALAAASARVLAMEDSLGSPLLLRTQRGAEPTSAGHALVLHARQMLKQLERLQGDLSDFGAGLRKSLRLQCNTEAMHEHMPDLLADYLLANPSVNLVLEERPGPDVVTALTEGSTDIGIVRENTDVFELETFPCLPNRLVLVTPPAHPLARASGPVLLEDADGFDVVGLPQGTALQDIWDQRVAQRGRRLNYRVRTNSFDEQCRLVARGAGIALMPLTAAQRHARVLPLHIVPLAEAFSSFTLRLCVRRLDKLPGYGRELVACILGQPGPATQGGEA